MPLFKTKAPPPTAPKPTLQPKLTPEATAEKLNLKVVQNNATKQLKPIRWAVYNLLKPQIDAKACGDDLKIEVETKDNQAVLTLQGSAQEVVDAAVEIVELAHNSKEGIVELRPKIMGLLQQETAVQELKQMVNMDRIYFSICESGLKIAVGIDVFDQAKQLIPALFCP